VFSQLLEEEYGPRLDGPGLQYLAYCVEGAQRIQKLLHDLLDYSHSGTAEAGVANWWIRTTSCSASGPAWRRPSKRMARR